MQSILRVSAFVFLLTAIPAIAQNYDLKPEQLTFTYRSFEGGEDLKCTQELESEASQDWSVVCKSSAESKNGEASKTSLRTYRVHLWLTAYTHPQPPRLSYEILYWVTDLTNRKTESAGSTTWFHLRDPSALDSLEIRQSVENDTAGLYLEIRL
jgi:hypothetical protein